MTRTAAPPTGGLPWVGRHRRHRPSARLRSLTGALALAAVAVPLVLLAPGQMVPRDPPVDGRLDVQPACVVQVAAPTGGGSWTGEGPWLCGRGWAVPVGPQSSRPSGSVSGERATPVCRCFDRRHAMA